MAEIKNNITIIGRLLKKSRTLAKIVYNFFFNHPIGYIYMFHMVRPKEDYISGLDGIRVSPKFFERFLKERSKYIDFISIDELSQRVKSHSKGQKPFGVVTFDDGYDDNFIYAYPILKKLQIPFVIYIAVNLINDHRPVWNYPLIIERIINRNTVLQLGNGNVYSCATEQEKNDVFLNLKSLMFSWPHKQLHTEFLRIFGPYLTEEMFPVDTLSLEQIKELAEDPLCTIGAHTMSHFNLMTNDTEALSYELGRSKSILEQITGKPVLHMSYPYGYASIEAQHFAKEVGYATAPLAGGGPIREKDKEIDMYRLKRIYVKETSGFLFVKSANILKENMY